MNSTEFWSIITLILSTAMFGTLFGLAWATHGFSRRDLAEFIQKALPVLSKYYPPLAFISLGSSIILNYEYRSDGWALFLSLVNTLAIVAFMVITVRGNVPINKKLEKWSFNSLPSDWESTFKRWQQYNNERSAIGIIGLICLIIAVSIR